MASILVIGYGNPLRGDDGLGPLVANALRESFGDQIAILTPHQLTPELAGPISQARYVMFIDARHGDKPGSIYYETLAPGAGDPGAFSHHASPAALLLLARHLYGSSPEAVLLSLIGAAFDTPDSISLPVRQVLAEFIRYAADRVLMWILELLEGNSEGNDDA